MELQILWAIPLAYAIHIAEESPRFVKWSKNYPKWFPDFNTRRFIFGNTVWMTYVLVSVILAIYHPETWTLMLGLSAASWIFANSWLHIFTTLKSGIYSPGVVTASMIYIPLPIYVYATVFNSGLLTPAVFTWSLIIGFAIMYVPMLLGRFVSLKR